MTPPLLASSSRRSLLATCQDYFSLCKPKVLALMLLTAWVGMRLASPEPIPWKILLFGMLGIAWVSGGAAVINHWADATLDAKMPRTHKRPIASGRVLPKNAFIFAFVLTAVGLACLWIFVNALTALLTIVSALGYAVCYTLFLKKASPQNIVIGGIFGATPPLLGFAAITNNIHPFALLLSLIIFLWTPPHFWALAIYRQEEYRQANIPMLPITHGTPFTKLCIVLYSLLLWAASLLPFALGFCGIVYFGSAVLLGGAFWIQTLILYRSSEKKTALKTFSFSIYYLLILFMALLADHYFIWVMR